jgi:hypothetical protein
MSKASKRLVDTETGESVKIAAGVLPDGRVLVQRESNGTLAVINVRQLAVESDDD